MEQERLRLIARLGDPEARITRNDIGFPAEHPACHITLTAEGKQSACSPYRAWYALVTGQDQPGVTYLRGRVSVGICDRHGRAGRNSAQLLLPRSAARGTRYRR